MLFYQQLLDNRLDVWEKIKTRLETFLAISAPSSILKAVKG